MRAQKKARKRLERQVDEKLTAYFEEAVSDTMPRWWGNVARKHVVQSATKHAKEEFMEVISKYKSCVRLE